MDLFLHFDKDILIDIKQELVNLYAQNPKNLELAAVHLIDLCSVFLKRLKFGLRAVDSTDKIIRMLCEIFDAVDSDSRGYISWIDFTNYCIRVGRNRFRPNAKQSAIEYHQRMDLHPSVAVRKMCFIHQMQLLYCFDNDTSAIRIFRKNAEQIGQFNPAKTIARASKIRSSGLQPYCNNKKKSSNSSESLTSKQSILSAARSTVSAIVYIDKRQQLVVCSSDGYISFWDSNASHMIGFVFCDLPQAGMHYCSSVDRLISWPEDTSDFTFRVWDPVLRKLKRKLDLHSAQILTVCEMGKHGVIASSSFDRKVLTWPVSLLVEENFKSRCQTPLVGHQHNIRAMVSAPEHDYILGAGFDFDVYAWDQLTHHLQLRLVGHRHSVVSVAVVYTPTERAVTADEGLVVKVWSIDRALAERAEVLQSLNLSNTISSRLHNFCSAFNYGATIIGAAERLLFCDLHTSVTDDVRPVIGGIGCCQRSNKLWLMGRKHVCLTDLASGRVQKRLTVLDPELTDASDSTAVGARDYTEKATVAFDTEDDVTVMTTDSSGKKIFVGTLKGRVLMFESSSFGLICELTGEPSHPILRDITEVETSASKGTHTQQDLKHLKSQYRVTATGAATTTSQSDAFNPGAVAGLVYASRDDLLVTAFANGVIKIFIGCHRVGLDDTVTHLSEKTGKPFPGADAAKLPARPVLRREARQLHYGTVTGLAVSERYNLIATSASDHTVKVFDYFTLEISAIYAAPRLIGIDVECTKLEFIPHLPILLGADGKGRISMWTVAPLKPAWVFTWVAGLTPLQGVGGVDDSSGQAKEDTGDDEDAPTFQGHTVPILCMRCVRLPESYALNTNVVDVLSHYEKESHRHTKDRHYHHHHHRKKEEDFSALIVGDEIGRIFVFNLSGLISRALQGVEPTLYSRLAIPLPGAGGVYQIVARPDLYYGLALRHNEINAMLHSPYGSQINLSFMGLNGANTRDILLIYRWNAHHAAVQTMHLIYEYQATNAAKSAWKPPAVIVTASEFAEVRIWTVQGQALGKMMELAGDASSSQIDKHGLGLLEANIEDKNGVIDNEEDRSSVTESNTEASSVVDAVENAMTSTQNFSSTNFWNFPKGCTSNYMRELVSYVKSSLSIKNVHIGRTTTQSDTFDVAVQQKDTTDNKVLLLQDLLNGDSEYNDDASTEDGAEKAFVSADYEEWRESLEVEGDKTDKEAAMAHLTLEEIRKEAQSQLRKNRRKMKRAKIIEKSWLSKARNPNFSLTAEEARKGGMAVLSLEVVKKSTKVKPSMSEQTRKNMLKSHIDRFQRNKELTMQMRTGKHIEEIPRKKSRIIDKVGGLANLLSETSLPDDDDEEEDDIVRGKVDEPNFTSSMDSWKGSGNSSLKARPHTAPSGQSVSSSTVSDPHFDGPKSQQSNTRVFSSGVPNLNTNQEEDEIKSNEVKGKLSPKSILRTSTMPFANNLQLDDTNSEVSVTSTTTSVQDINTQNHERKMSHNLNLKDLKELIVKRKSSKEEESDGSSEDSDNLEETFKLQHNLGRKKSMAILARKQSISVVPNMSGLGDRSPKLDIEHMGVSAGGSVSFQLPSHSPDRRASGAFLPNMARRKSSFAGPSLFAPSPSGASPFTGPSYSSTGTSNHLTVHDHKKSMTRKMSMQKISDIIYNLDKLSGSPPDQSTESTSGKVASPLPPQLHSPLKLHQAVGNQRNEPFSDQIQNDTRGSTSVSSGNAFKRVGSPIDGRGGGGNSLTTHSLLLQTIEAMQMKMISEEGEGEDDASSVKTDTTVDSKEEITRRDSLNKVNHIPRATVTTPSLDILEKVHFEKVSSSPSNSPCDSRHDATAVSWKSNQSRSHNSPGSDTHKSTDLLASIASIDSPPTAINSPTKNDRYSQDYNPLASSVPPAKILSNYEIMLQSTTLEMRMQRTTKRFDELMIEPTIRRPRKMKDDLLSEIPFGKQFSIKKKTPKNTSVGDDQVEDEELVKKVSNGGIQSKNRDIGRGRYGPYKAREVLSFLSLLQRVNDISEKGIGSPMKRQKSIEMRKFMMHAEEGDDEDNHASMKYDIKVLLAQPEIDKFTVLKEALKAIPIPSHGINILQATQVPIQTILKAVFPFASEADRLRIDTLNQAKIALTRAFSSLTPKVTDGGFKLGKKNLIGTMQTTEGISAMRSSTGLLGNLLPMTPLGAGSSSSISKVKTLEGWTLSKVDWEALKRKFEMLQTMQSGTVTIADFFEIVSTLPNITAEMSMSLESLVMKTSLHKGMEVGPTELMSLIKDCLKIHIKLHHELSRIGNVASMASHQNKGKISAAERIKDAIRKTRTLLTEQSAPVSEGDVSLTRAASSQSKLSFDDDTMY